MKSRVREDFEEMDFENADQRNHMESHVNSIEGIIAGLISKLDSMTFEIEPGVASGVSGYTLVRLQ